MTKEERELLLIDLSARLRYGVKILIENDNDELPFRTDKAYINTMDEEHWSYFKFDRIVITPYLRPLSSMTEEERKEYKRIAPGLVIYDGIHIPNVPRIDWLNAHHFDYRGLIEKELALVAPEGMYN